MVAKEVYHVYEYLKKIQSQAANRFKLPQDKINIGHAILQAFDENPDRLCQVDCQTGENQDNKYVSNRVQEVSKSLYEAGLRPGDIILVNSPNCLETCIPIFAGLLNGLAILPIDFMSTSEEILYYLSLVNPKAVFCCKENEDRVKKSVKSINVTPYIVVLDSQENNIDSFTEIYKNDEVEYSVPEFDLSTPAILICTSGTTGKPKVAIITHQNIWCSFPYNFSFFKKFPVSTQSLFFTSSVQWISGMYLYLGSAIFGFIRIQTRVQITTKVLSEVFNNYKPTFILTNTVKLTEIFDNCDLGCLEFLFIGGSALNKELEVKFKNRYPNVLYTKGYGMTELFQLIFKAETAGPLGSIGKPFTDRYQYRIVNPENGMEITKPHEIGELHVKDACKFVGYYKNDEETKKLFTNDGYLKTGDLVYRDEENYYFVVDRLKMTLKYMGFHVYPQEIEDVLRRHDGVSQAVVTGIPGEGGDLPVALIVKSKDVVTAKELIKLVDGSLSDYKRLRGGVVFLKELPLTVTHKLDKNKIKEMAQNMKREFK